MAILDLSGTALGTATIGLLVALVREPEPEAALAVTRARLRPELVSMVGLVAIVVLVWLMETKPL